jgi:prepilin-type N-terminal cleavage/methylation domain-containing protein
MRNMNNECGPAERSNRGMTLVELLIVIAVMVILISIAVPSYMTWRQSASYHAVGREIASFLREARSKSIAANLQFRVEFGPGGGPLYTSYGLRQGNRTNNTNWADTVNNPPVSEWIAAPNGVFISAASPIWFNSDGTSNAPAGGELTVFIQDSSSTTHRSIGVASTGRIRMY